MIRWQHPVPRVTLVLLNLAAAGLLADALVSDIAPAPPPPVAREELSLSDLPAPRAASLGEARRRPVFLASRRPWRPPPPPAPAPTPAAVEIAPPALRIEGILLGAAGGARAYVSLEGDTEIRRLGEGDEIEGWRVLAIRAGEVDIGHEDRKVTARIDKGGARGVPEGNGVRSSVPRTRQSRPPQRP